MTCATPKFLQKRYEFLNKYGFLGASLVGCPDFLVSLVKEADKYGICGEEGGNEEDGEYFSNAVHFSESGETSLGTDLLVGTDGEAVSFVFWYKLPSSSNNNFWYSDPDAALGNYCQTEQEPTFHGPYTSLSGDFGSPETSGAVSLKTTATPNPGSWRCIISSVFTNVEPQVGKIYVGDVDISATLTPPDAAFLASIANRPFYVGSVPGGAPCANMDFADFRFMLNKSLLVSGDIPLATRRLFIDENGKPVRPSVATATLGIPTVLFSGDANSFGENQGSAGAFTLSGPLTNASTSPSD